jgi:hypothetical protein
MKLLATLPILAVALWCVLAPSLVAKCLVVVLAAVICGLVWWRSEP